MHTRKVYTRLIGQLGNQLFQMAAGQAAAHALEAKLIVDARYVPDADQLVRFGLAPFVREDAGMPPHKSERMAYLAWRTLGRAPKLLREFKGFRWGQAFPEGHLYLHGYWQERRIVEAAALDIQKPAWVQVPPRAAHEVCVHVRGGDYLTLKSRTQHATLGADYYNQAIAALGAELGALEVTLFTNDVAHAKTLALDFDYRFAAPELEADPIVSLWAMAQFQNLVIANSTFSWWASYLAGPSARVVCPPEHLVR